MKIVICMTYLVVLIIFGIAMLILENTERILENVSPPAFHSEIIEYADSTLVCSEYITDSVAITMGDTVWVYVTSGLAHDTIVKEQK